jgi:CHASE2 domain-containing sensor protein
MSLKQVGNWIGAVGYVVALLCAWTRWEDRDKPYYWIILVGLASLSTALFVVGSWEKPSKRGNDKPIPWLEHPDA